MCLYMGGVGRELQEPLDYEFSNHSKLLVCKSLMNQVMNQRSAKDKTLFVCH
jgi:hypothetical protein